MKELTIFYTVVEAKYLCPGDYFFTNDGHIPWMALQTHTEDLNIKASQEVIIDGYQVSKVKYFNQNDKVYMLRPPRVVSKGFLRLYQIL